MLFALLLACLTVFACAFPCDLQVFEHKLKYKSLQEFLEYLDTCEFDCYQCLIFGVFAKRNFSCEAWLAVLEKTDHPYAIVYAKENAIYYNRLDVLKLLIERGYNVLDTFPTMLIKPEPYNDHMEVLKFYSELEGSVGLYDLRIKHYKFFNFYKKISQFTIEIFYFLTGEGYYVCGDELYRIVRSLDLSIDVSPLSQAHYEFLYFLIENMGTACNCLVMLSSALAYQNRRVVECFLEFPEMTLCLRLAKHAAGVLFAQDEGILTELFGPRRDNEGDFIRKGFHMSSWALSELQSSFQQLVVSGEEERALLEPLAVEDLQLTVTPQLDARKRFYIFLLVRFN